MKPQVKLVEGPIDINDPELGEPFGPTAECFIFVNYQTKTKHMVPLSQITEQDHRTLVAKAARKYLNDPPHPHGPGTECNKASDVPATRNYLIEMWRDGGVFETIDEMIRPASLPIFDQGPASPHREYLRRANLWWVGAEMLDLVTTAADGVPSDLRTSELPIPSQFGFVVFEKPWFGQDSQIDGEVFVHAMSWSFARMQPTISRPKTEDSIALTSYRKLDFTNWRDVNFALGCGALSEARYDPNILKNGTDDELLNNLHGQSWAYLGHSDWPFADELIQSPYSELSEDAAESWVEDRRIFAAFVSLIKQESFVERTTSYGPRNVQRAAQRLGVSKEINSVSVIDIHKRPASSESEASETSGESNYSHRWWVDPFVRWQGVGPGRKERRLTLVKGHVRGPEDKPFKPKEKVRSWVSTRK